MAAAVYNINSIDLVVDNDDLLNEILLRLPAKSLIRFKSVSKKWLSVISSVRFCHQHTLRRPKLPQSLIINIITTPQKKFFYSNQTINGGKLMMPRTPYCLHSSLEHRRIIQACNGLLLLELESLYVKEGCYGLYHDPPAKERDGEWSYYVYNPTTRQSRQITLAENAEYPLVAAASLAFDPSKSPYYKIVCIRYNRQSHLPLPIPIWSYSYQIEVYDSESHSWKVSTKQAFTASHLLTSDGIYWNNGIYWRTYGAYYRFDINKNEMTTLSFPRPPIAFRRGIYFDSYLQESKGRLYHLQLISEQKAYGMYSVRRQERESVAMWELVRDEDDDDDQQYSRWLFKYHHSLGEDTCTDLLRLTVGSDGDGDETCSLLVHQNEMKARVYNFHDKTYEDVCDYFTTKRRSVLVFQFGEVLALV